MAEKNRQRENDFMKIAVFGGSFDPPHKGHARLLKAAATRLRPDLMLVIPSFHSPLKNKSISPAADRAAMAALLAAKNEAKTGVRSVVDLFEIRRKETVYTYQTLEYLKNAYPGAALFLVIGSDCAMQFDKWKNPGAVKKLAKIVVGARKGFECGRSRLKKSGFDVLPGRFSAVSSAQVRSRIVSRGKIPRCVSGQIAEHIAGKELYALNIHKWLAKNLDETRLRHTLAVSVLCAKLAEKWGENPCRAALAGLLHDAGKAIPADRMARYAKKKNIQADRLEQICRLQPALLHSYISAEIAKNVFGIDDNGVLAAVENHTLGRPGMEPLEKILYIADISSADRDFAGAGDIRRLAFENLNSAALETARCKLAHVLRAGKWLHPGGVETWNSLAAEQTR